jgi:hypothetical protein
MFAPYIAAFLIAAISLAQCLNGPLQRSKPYPICEECRDPELMIAPGIGFDLTHTYG